MLSMQQRADYAAEPARMVGSAPVLDDFQAVLAGQARCEREHPGGRPVLGGADQQSVEPAEANELAELLTTSVRDDDLFEEDPRRAEEHVSPVQQALGSSGAVGPWTRLVVDRYQERDAERLGSGVLAADRHQVVWIGVRIGRDERTIQGGWAGGLFEFHFGPRSVFSVEAL
jgi:hypothetical protein